MELAPAPSKVSPNGQKRITQTFFRKIGFVRCSVQLQPHDAALARIDGLQCRSRGLIQAAAIEFNCFCLRIPWSSWFIIHLVFLHPAVEAASVIYSKWALPQRESCPKHIMVSCFHPTALAHTVLTKQRRKNSHRKGLCFFFFFKFQQMCGPKWISHFSSLKNIQQCLKLPLVWAQDSEVNGTPLSLYTVSVCLFIAGTLNYVPGFLKKKHRNFWEVRLHAEERWSVEQHGSAEKLQEVNGGSF